MLKIAKNIFQSDIERPFSNSVNTCAYFLKRSGGNFLLYSSSQIEKDFEFITRNGGVKAQFLNHRHEASSFCSLVTTAFTAPLYCHALEKEAVEDVCILGGTLESVPFPADFTPIFTPGHCPGSTCYLWFNENQGFLFTGDTLYLTNGRWSFSVSNESRVQMIASLKKLKSLSVKYMIPSLFIGKKQFECFDSREDYVTAIQKCIQRLELGELH